MNRDETYRETRAYSSLVPPCIWPTVRSVSSLSMPASSNILGGVQDKNFPDRPWNQPGQNFSVSARFILHVYFCTWNVYIGKVNID